MSDRQAQLGKRLLGTICGAGYCLLGTYGVLGARTLPDPAAGDRSLWWGVTLIIVGLIAMGGSWYVDDVDRIWCRPPRRKLR
ncbi:MAG TPA: hypothetical protein VLD61_10085 [Methylomirabilota bacterium]|nr:hypothetical protein [Methylomirabilota bacterium]